MLAFFALVLLGFFALIAKLHALAIARTKSALLEI